MHHEKGCYEKGPIHVSDRASTHTIKIAIITTVYTLTSPSLYAAEPDEIRASTD